MAGEVIGRSDELLALAAESVRDANELARVPFA